MVVRYVRSPEVEARIRSARVNTKMAEVRTCKKCYKVLLRRKTKANKKGFCSKTCSRIFHGALIKKMVPRIKAVVIKKPKRISPKFYETREWQELRYKVIKNYERKCMVCFRTNLELHVDHIKPISLNPELALEFSNLQVLCRDCNLGKGNSDSIDWRPK